MSSYSAALAITTTVWCSAAAAVKSVFCARRAPSTMTRMEAGLADSATDLTLWGELVTPQTGIPSPLHLSRTPSSDTTPHGRTSASLATAPKLVFSPVQTVVLER